MEGKGDRVPTVKEAWLALALGGMGILSAQFLLVISLSAFFPLSGGPPDEGDILDRFRAFLSALPTENLLLLNSIAIGLGLLLPILWLGHRNGWSWTAAFRLQRVQGRSLSLALVGGLAAGVIASQFILWLRQLLPDPEISKLDFLLKVAQKTNAFWVMFIAILLPAFHEELFFRGVFQKGLEQKFPSPLAILISSSFFAILHLDPIQAAGAFLLGLYLGTITVWTNSIFPAILTHAAQNIMTFLTVSLFRPFPPEEALSPLAEEPSPTLALWSGVVLFFVLILLWRSRNHKIPPVHRGEGGTVKCQRG